VGEVHWSENDHQAALFNWARAQIADGRGELRALGAIPNGHGQIGGDALRHCKELGHIPGMPDIFLFLPRGGFHGLFIELKTLKRSSRLRRGQVEFSKVLGANGYAVHSCHGYRECIRVIDAYVSMADSATPSAEADIPGGGATPSAEADIRRSSAHSPLGEQLDRLIAEHSVPLVPLEALLLERIGSPANGLRGIGEALAEDGELAERFERVRARQEVEIFTQFSRGQMVDSTARFLCWKVLGQPIDLSRPPAAPGTDGGEVDMETLFRSQAGGADGQ
jgi:hypothetical protein